MLSQLTAPPPPSLKYAVCGAAEGALRHRPRQAAGVPGGGRVVQPARGGQGAAGGPPGVWPRARRSAARAGHAQQRSVQRVSCCRRCRAAAAAAALPRAAHHHGPLQSQTPRLPFPSPPPQVGQEKLTAAFNEMMRQDPKADGLLDQAMDKFEASPTCRFGACPRGWRSCCCMGCPCLSAARRWTS